MPYYEFKLDREHATAEQIRKYPEGTEDLTLSAYAWLKGRGFAVEGIMGQPYHVDRELTAGIVQEMEAELGVPLEVLEG